MLEDPFNHLAVPRDVVARFFAVFARCEYAMKETSYRRDDHGIAAPAWQRLANDAATWLVVPAGSDLERAVSLLMEKPPRLQSFTGGWHAAPLRGGSAVAKAVDAAVRVRHNLFHGGKHTPQDEAGRDRGLVEAAMTLLLAVIEQAPGDLAGAYNHG